MKKQTSFPLSCIMNLFSGQTLVFANWIHARYHSLNGVMEHNCPDNGACGIILVRNLTCRR
jgi:hypothetical protein